MMKRLVKSKRLIIDCYVLLGEVKQIFEIKKRTCALYYVHTTYICMQKKNDQVEK